MRIGSAFGARVMVRAPRMRPQSWNGPFGSAETGPVGRSERTSMEDVRRTRRDGVSNEVMFASNEWVTDEGG